MNTSKIRQPLRGKIFGSILRRLETREKLPGLLVSLEIQILLNATAGAFGTRGKQVWYLSAGQALKEYCDFTMRCMEDPGTDLKGKRKQDPQEQEQPGRSLQEVPKRSPQEQLVRSPQERRHLAERIYCSAFRLGNRVRKVTGLTEQEELQKLVFLLYRGIGVRMDGDLPGEILVKECYFSQQYSPWQCALMSCMDSGVIAGIFGGGKLTFTERITEGCGHCRAHFQNK